MKAHTGTGVAKLIDVLYCCDDPKSRLTMRSKFRCMMGRTLNSHGMRRISAISDSMSCNAVEDLGGV